MPPVTFDDIPVSTRSSKGPITFDDVPMKNRSWLDTIKAANPKRGLFGTSLGKDSDILQKARIPSEMVQGISNAMMDAYEPQTQSVALNAALRTPQTLASTIGQNVANTITPENAAIQGSLSAVRAIAPPILNWLGKGAERISGLEYEEPGALKAAFEKPSRIFGQGTESAGQEYGNLIDRSQVRNTMKGNKSFNDVVDEAANALQAGNLNPDEALVARQSLDRIKRTLPQANYFELRNSFDEIAKTKFAGADKAFKEALISDALREPFPVNKTGGASKWLSGIGALGVGTAMKTGNPLYLLGLGASPAVQGATAATLGAVAPFIQNPALGLAAGQGLAAYLNRRQ